MIDENTPYKQAEIIRDTWPQLYYLKQRDNDVDNDSEPDCQSAPRQYQ